MDIAVFVVELDLEKKLLNPNPYKIPRKVETYSMYFNLVTHF